jgi:hypothetical protein
LAGMALAVYFLYCCFAAAEAVLDSDANNIRSITLSLFAPECK